MVKCPDCNQEVPENELARHRLTHPVTSCPWGCTERILQEKYAEHLFSKHYKKKEDKVIGPFPLGVK